MFEVVTHHSQFSTRKRWLLDRFEGTFSQPNPFAIYLTMLIVMGAALFPHLTQKKKIGMADPALLLAGVPLLHLHAQRVDRMCDRTSSQLRSWGSRQPHARAHGRRRSWSRLSLLPSIAGRFADLGSSTSAAGYSSNSLSWRFSYWGDVLPLANADPITGIGLNMSSLATSQQKEPHNDFLRAYVETGIVGTIAYLALLVSMVLVARDSMRFTKRRAWSYERSIAVGFAACVIAFVAHQRWSPTRDHRGRSALVLRCLCRGRICGHALSRERGVFVGSSASCRGTRAVFGWVC